MLKAINLRSGYDSVCVIDGVSIHVDEGEVVALLGANGSGKSTLLKTIAGLIAPTEGRVLLKGKNASGWPAEKIAVSGLTLVPEGRGLFPGMSVIDNLRLGGYARRLKSTGLAKAIDRALTSFPDLKQRLGQKAGSLSGGQQQMLALAKALVGSPEILLLDEPSTGLAPMMAAEVFDRLKLLKEEGLTLLIAEQNANSALQMADRAYVIENGKVTLEGSSGDLMSSDDVKKAYLGL